MEALKSFHVLFDGNSLVRVKNTELRPKIFESLAAVYSSNVIKQSPSTSAFSKLCFQIFSLDEWMGSTFVQLLAIVFMLIEKDKLRTSKKIIFSFFILSLIINTIRTCPKIRFKFRYQPRLDSTS